MKKTNIRKTGEELGMVSHNGYAEQRLSGGLGSHATEVERLALPSPHIQEQADRGACR